MLKLILGLGLCAPLASPAYADIIVDFSFSGKVEAIGDVPGGGSGGETATFNGTLDFTQTGANVPASEIYGYVTGIPVIQTSFIFGGLELGTNQFDITPDGEFLGGAFHYGSIGVPGADVGLYQNYPYAPLNTGSFSFTNGSETDYYLEEFQGMVAFDQVTPVSEPRALAVFVTGLLGLVIARTNIDRGLAAKKTLIQA